MHQISLAILLAVVHVLALAEDTADQIASQSPEINGVLRDIPDDSRVQKLENIVHDDGTGAQLSFSLPVHGKWNDMNVEYGTFRILVVKDDKFLLFADLVGAITNDGNFFFGRIIIPSHFVDSAEILLLGSPANSSLGVSKKLKVSHFERVARKKSWTEQQ